MVGIDSRNSPWLAVLILVNTALAFLLVTRRRSVMVVGSAAALLALSTGWWNPLVRGGTAYVTENALSRAIREVDAAAEGETVWAAVGSSDRGNLFRMLGVASVGGAIMVPQLELWRRLDTAGDAEKVYNRYAHVGFAPGPPRFHLSSHHGFVLYVDPEQEILATLGVTHLMVSTKEGSRWRPYWNQFLPLEVIGEHYLFALPLERDSASL